MTLVETYNDLKNSIARKEIKNIPLISYFASQNSEKGPESEKKKENQDRTLVNSRYGFFGVFDGLGGHQAGEKASELAQNYFQSALLKMHKDLNNSQAVLDRETIAKALLSGWQQAKIAIQSLNNIRGYQGLGTTVSVGQPFIEDGKLYLATLQAGDSRVYSYDQEGNLIKITKDQGKFSEEALEAFDDCENEEEIRQKYPQFAPFWQSYLDGRKYIISCLGANDHEPTIKFTPLPADSIGAFACSDGVTDNLMNRTIKGFLKTNQNINNFINKTVESAVQYYKKPSTETQRRKPDDVSMAGVEWEYSYPNPETKSGIEDLLRPLTDKLSSTFQNLEQLINQTPAFWNRLSISKDTFIKINKKDRKFPEIKILNRPLHEHLTAIGVSGVVRYGTRAGLGMAGVSSFGLAIGAGALTGSIIRGGKEYHQQIQQNTHNYKVEMAKYKYTDFVELESVKKHFQIEDESNSLTADQVAEIIASQMKLDRKALMHVLKPTDLARIGREATKGALIGGVGGIFGIIGADLISQLGHIKIPSIPFEHIPWIQSFGFLETPRFLPEPTPIPKPTLPPSYGPVIMRTPGPSIPTFFPSNTTFESIVYDPSPAGDDNYYQSLIGDPKASSLTGELQNKIFAQQILGIKDFDPFTNPTHRALIDNYMASDRYQRQMDLVYRIVKESNRNNPNLFHPTYEDLFRHGQNLYIPDNLAERVRQVQ